MALNLFRTHLNLFYKMRFNLENKILHTYKDRATKCGSGLLNLKQHGKPSHGYAPQGQGQKSCVDLRRHCPGGI